MTSAGSAYHRDDKSAEPNMTLTHAALRRESNRRRNNSRRPYDGLA